MKSIRQTRSRYTKRKTLRQKRSRSRSRRTRKSRISRRTRRTRRSRRQRGGQTTSVGCQITAPRVDQDALAIQQHNPTPNVTQPQSNSYNNYALVNDRSHLYVKM